jgi:hypothetical protein
MRGSDLRVCIGTKGAYGLFPSIKMSHFCSREEGSHLVRHKPLGLRRINLAALASKANLREEDEY